MKKYDTDACHITIRPREQGVDEDMYQYIHAILEELIAHIVRSLSPADLVGMRIMSSSGEGKNDIGVPLRRADQLSSEVVLETVTKILQSNESFFLDGGLAVRYVVVRMKSGGGGGRKRDEYSVYDEYCRRNGGIVVIGRSDDNLCLAKALVVGLAHAHREDSAAARRRWRAVNNPLSQARLKREAEQLCRDAGVDLRGGGSIVEVARLQDHLQDYTVTVFEDDRHGRRVLYGGPVSEDRRPIDLILGDNHFNLVTSLTAAFYHKRYCRHCHYGYNNVEAHRCPLQCLNCNHQPICAEVPGEQSTCGACNRFFLSAACRANHLKPYYVRKQSTCEVVTRCRLCDKVTNKLSSQKRPHVCGESYCVRCEKSRPAGHYCFMKKYAKKTAKRRDGEGEKILTVFYDLECTQEVPVEGSPDTYEHQPNFCVAQHVCSKCLQDGDVTNPCDTCGEREHVFSGRNTLKNFMAYVTSHTGFNKVIVIAHNAKGYDSQFVLGYMVSSLRWEPEVIMTGTKIMTIQKGKFKFIDSVNYFGCRLAALPKMFDLQCDAKGHFPHFFNKAANWEYVGPLPAAEDYGIATMGRKDRADFMRWYEEELQSAREFDFQREILKYCRQDTTILRLACLEFRRIFLAENGVDPFLEALTIASACMTSYRRNHLKEDTIGLTPIGGYRLRDRQSAVALEWLRWLEHSQGLHLDHAGNGREHRVGKYKVSHTISSLYKYV